MAAVDDALLHASAEVPTPRRTQSVQSDLGEINLTQRNEKRRRRRLDRRLCCSRLISNAIGLSPLAIYSITLVDRKLGEPLPGAPTVET